MKKPETEDEVKPETGEDSADTATENSKKAPEIPHLIPCPALLLLSQVLSRTQPLMEPKSTTKLRIEIMKARSRLRAALRTRIRSNTRRNRLILRTRMKIYFNLQQALVAAAVENQVSTGLLNEDDRVLFRSLYLPIRRANLDDLKLECGLAFRKNSNKKCG